MSLAKKLREVVAANFIEIARVDTPPVKEEEKARIPEPTPTNLGNSAEAELDSFLKDIGASPATNEASTAFVEPEIVAEPEPIPAAPVLVLLSDAISDEGEVDFPLIFQKYELQPPAFSAEQAMTMLQSLPRDLALRTKRVTVNTTLSAIGKVVGATPQDIVADASRKKEVLERYVETLGQEIDETTETTEAEINRLQAEINAHKEKLRLLNRKRSAAAEVCRSRTDMFDQVTLFFDYDEAQLNAPEPVVEEQQVAQEDMPAFMREDAVRRMLGINEDFTDENGEFDPIKFAQLHGDGTENPESEDGARRPRAKK